MGMSKAKVAFGLICESLCVMVLCLCIGLNTGRFIAQPVSNAIINEQKAAVEIVLTWESILFLIAASLTLGLLTNIMGIFYIARHEPMKILQERS